MASVGACSCSVGISSSHAVSKSDVASQITSKMTDAAGNKPDTVNCPGDLPAKVGRAESRGAAELRDEGQSQTFNVNVTVTSVDGGNVKFDMVETVDKDQVASIITRQTDPAGGQANPDSVTCPDNLKGVEGADAALQTHRRRQDQYGQ